MEREGVKDIIIDILQELHEDVDFTNEEKLVDDKVLDSFDLVSLVTELSERLEIDATAKDFVPENFNSLDRLTDMALRLMDED